MKKKYPDVTFTGAKIGGDCLPCGGCRNFSSVFSWEAFTHKFIGNLAI
jgi:hypothetical protein